MEVISNEIMNTIQFNVNFDLLQKKYRYGRSQLFHRHNFLFSLEDGTNYPAYIILFHTAVNTSGFILVMEKEEMKNANLNVAFQLTINENINEIGEIVIGKNFNTTNESGPTKPLSEVFGIRHYFKDIGKLKSVKGKMTFTFETKSLFTFHKELFIHSLGLNLVTPGGKEDLTIICQDQKIEFEKQILITVSPVFKEMLESQWTEESQNGQVEIKEVMPETLLAFKSLLLNSKDFKKEDLNIELMIFADRYDIKALLDLCGKYIDSFAVNEENIFEFVQGLYLINNGSFMNNAILLMKKNYGALKQDPRWEGFAKKHPDCVLKMLDHSMEN